jgi:CheY-like chemotaxis protein
MLRVCQTIYTFGYQKALLSRVSLIQASHGLHILSTPENMRTQLNSILLIDDDEPTNFLNRLTLEQVGCTQTIHVAQSGQAALDFLQDAQRPDLIFLDVNMPAMDGWEFLEKYRSLPADRKADIVLIMLTTSLNPDDELRTRAIPEVSGFENKPLSQQRVRQLLEKYFNKR